jgi:hypothetical protein
MFMCVVNRKSVNKLDLTWKQSFLIDPGGESRANSPSKLRSIGQNCRRIPDAIRKAQEGSNYGLGHEDGPHLYARQTQQKR